jgi:hypothetical protein
MKYMNVWTKALVIVALACSALSLRADQPTDPPPHGHAYGYYLKDGVQVLFVYMDDGSRIIDLSNGKPRTEYLVEASEDLVSWHALVILRIQNDGTATVVDTTPIPYCFYRVTRVK